MKRRFPSTRHLSQFVTGHSVAVFALVALGTYTLTLHGATVASLIASSASSLNTAPVTIYFTPYQDKTIAVGDTADLDVNISADEPINVVGATITFPHESLEIVGISKKNSFLDLWTEDTTIKEQEGEVHFSGGTTQLGGRQGIATVLTITVRAKHEGDATIGFKDVEIFASDGSGEHLPTDAHAYTLSAILPTTIPTAGGSAGAPTTPPQNPDLNGDGRIGVVDVSILAVKMISTYDARYDLNGDGRINLGDMSILFSKM